jgi:hypothetical protein
MIIIIEFCENGSPGAISHQGEAGMKKTPILYDLLILRMEKYYRDFSNFVFKIFTVC